MHIYAAIIIITFVAVIFIDKESLVAFVFAIFWIFLGIFFIFAIAFILAMFAAAVTILDGEAKAAVFD
jgi:hypothetical protein